ncbi:hypothetical protein C3E93_24770, partial [Klebsiella pneumoniae]
RVAGLHFFNPAPVMKLVEVVSGLATSTEVVEQLRLFRLPLSPPGSKTRSGWPDCTFLIRRR